MVGREIEQASDDRKDIPGDNRYERFLWPLQQKCDHNADHDVDGQERDLFRNQQLAHSCGQLVVPTAKKNEFRSLFDRMAKTSIQIKQINQLRMIVQMNIVVGKEVSDQKKRPANEMRVQGADDFDGQQKQKKSIEKDWRGERWIENQ